MPDTFSIATDLGEIARLAAWADAFAVRTSVPGPKLFALQLCLEEQVSNVIRHGGGATVTVTLELRDTVLVATIADQGPAFDPLAAPPPDRPDSLLDAKVGGLGIHLMRRFASAVSYERQDDTNLITLSFDLSS